MTNWHTLITMALADNQESWESVLHCTLSAEQLAHKFDAGYGGYGGAAFTLWTAHYVYFPVTYDGSAMVHSVPRNPCDITTDIICG